MNNSTVKIEFINHDAARYFINWLSGQGEQDYWEWMQYREEESDEEAMTATQFGYSSDELTVTTICSRLDKK